LQCLLAKGMPYGIDIKKTATQRAQVIRINSVLLHPPLRCLLAVISERPINWTYWEVFSLHYNMMAVHQIVRCLTGGKWKMRWCASLLLRPLDYPSIRLVSRNTLNCRTHNSVLSKKKSGVVAWDGSAKYFQLAAYPSSQFGIYSHLTGFSPVSASLTC
jgi:hypothetical protein